MKRIALLLFFACGALATYGQLDSSIRYFDSTVAFQDIVNQAIANAKVADSTDTTEGGEVHTLERWLDFAGNRISNNVAQGADRFDPYNQALYKYTSNISSYCQATGKFQRAWKFMGPDINYWGQFGSFQGRINCIWVDPVLDPINHLDHILAGSDAGGRAELRGCDCCARFFLSFTQSWLVPVASLCSRKQVKLHDISTPPSAFLAQFI